MEKRTKTVNIRVSEEEWGKIKARAESRGLTVSCWLRVAAMELGSGPATTASAGSADAARERYLNAEEAALRQNQQNAAMAGRRY
jgi:hypothetical protein